MGLLRRCLSNSDNFSEPPHLCEGGPRSAICFTCLCLTLGVWLLVLYGENIGSYSGDGENSNCGRAAGGSVDLEKYIIGQGLLNVLSILWVLVAAAIGVSESSCGIAAVCVYAIVPCVHLALWIWGQVEVYRAPSSECGEFLAQGRSFIYITYAIIVAVIVALFPRGLGENFPCCPASHGESGRRAFSFVFLLALWCGVFFGLNWPEIQKANWTRATCRVVAVKGTADAAADPEAALEVRYPCCSALCGGCSECYSYPTCGSLDVKMTNMSNWRRGDWPDGLTCGGGYLCCAQCCSTCCDRTCDDDGSCSETCSSCNCYCCSSVHQRCCTKECNFCYHPQYTVDIIDGDTVVNTVTQQKYCKVCERHGCEQDNIHGMHIFLTVDGNTISPGFEHECFYDPDNHDKMAWEVSYTASRWVLFAIPSLFLIALVWPSCTSCRCMSGGYGYRSRGIEDDEKPSSGAAGQVNEEPLLEDEHGDAPADRKATEGEPAGGTAAAGWEPPATSNEPVERAV